MMNQGLPASLRSDRRSQHSNSHSKQVLAPLKNVPIIKREPGHTGHNQPARVLKALSSSQSPIKAQSPVKSR